MSSIVFLGGGRIASALIAGLRRAKFLTRLVVYDRHPEKLRRLQREFGVVAEPDLGRALAAAHLLIVAVRPASVEDLLRQVPPLDRSIVAVSLAAGVPLSRLRKRLGPRVEWARAMPSPACRFGRSLTAVTYDRSMTKRTRREVRKLFGAVGPVLEIPEKQFDAFTVTYSVSHGYHALSALAAAAEKVGLPRKTALLASAHALADGIACWRENQTPLSQLLSEAATPGGIAATILSAMDHSGYRKIVERAMRVGVSRACSLGKD